VFFAMQQVSACDVCGIFLNVLPHDRTSQVGLLWRARTLSGTFASTGYTKHGGPVAADDGKQRIREQVQALELRADIWLAERWSLFTALPVVNTYRSVNGSTALDLYGLGDAIAVARYQLVNTKQGEQSSRWAHRLRLGAGAKAPLGRSNGLDVQTDLRPGSGTWDALMTVEYAVRKAHWGASVNQVLRYNTMHTDQRRQGHGFNSTVELFREVRWNTKTIMPSLGAYAEFLGKDQQYAEPVIGTGGSTYFTHVGARAWLGRAMLTAAWQHAVAWQIGEQMTPNRDRVVVGVSYIIQKQNSNT
jgi:hypothetical protein